MSASEALFIGVDVGTGSARAALVTSTGKIIKNSVRPIKTWNPKPDFYEQSSEDIWSACVSCIKEVTTEVEPDMVKGLGFDATCSLVALDSNARPISVSPTGINDQNIILWMDHRAAKQADKINSSKHPILKYVGGAVSLEMELPKLLWLKTHLPNQYNQTALFFDLPDLLTYKATNHETRSLCSLVCKWNYEIAENHRWPADFLDQIGLGDLAESNWRKIGAVAERPGAAVGAGLSQRAAAELGLRQGTPVGASMIDAHAGGLGMIGCRAEGVSAGFSSRLGLICGTSTCVMAVSGRAVFAEGVWGPYFSAMVPGMWLNEGGQSVTGKLVEHVVNTHPYTAELRRLNGRGDDAHVSDLLNVLCGKYGGRLTENYHVYPDFHGNRSPVADSSLCGAICGLAMEDNSEKGLAVLYLATLQALAYGTRHIMETLVQSGHSFESVLVCGGLSKNQLFVETIADVCGLPAICPDEGESVLLGAAILGACAAGHFEGMETAVKSMGGKGTVFAPRKEMSDYHERKYRVYRRMLEDQLAYRKIMSSGGD